jgi:8-oxo-dGTP diphosphatase
VTPRAESWWLNPPTSPVGKSPAAWSKPTNHPCSREAREEIGLEVRIGRLLCVDYVGVEIAPFKRLMFTFDAGVIDDLEIAQIVLPPDELSEFRFVTLAESQELLPERLALRVRQSLIALKHLPQTVYLENGCVVSAD